MFARRLCVVAVAVAVAVGALAGPAAPTAGALPPPSPFKGIADDDYVYGDALPQIIDTTRRVHADYLRVQLRWHRVAPRRPARPRDDGDSRYEWAPFDRIVDAAKQARVGLLVDIWGAPGWANGDRPAGQMPPSARDYADFVHAAVTRYERRAPGTIYNYEIWQEPNYELFGGPQDVTPAPPLRYAALLDAAYGEIKAADRTAQVLGGALSPAGDNSRVATRPLDFLRAMRLPDGRRPRLDRVSVHAYPITLAPGFRYPLRTRRVRTSVRTQAGTVVRVRTVRSRKRQPRGAVDIGSLPNVVKVARSLYPKAPLFVSETGVLTRKTRFYSVTATPAEQGAVITRMWNVFRAAGIGDVVLYPTRDPRSAPDADGRETGVSGGLLDDQGNDLPVIAAVARLGRHGAELDPPAAPPPGGGLLPGLPR